MSILEEISDWQVEARNEDPNRYFFHRREFEKITNGKVSFVIGRKGSGKTAIAEQLSLRHYDNFSRKLSFKNFPFNLIYSKSDDNYNRPNQFVSIWRYVIYRYICSMIVENAALSEFVDSKIVSALRIDVNEALDLTIDRVVGQGGAVSFLGVGGSISQTRSLSQMPISAANETLSDLYGILLIILNTIYCLTNWMKTIIRSLKAAGVMSIFH